MPRSFEPTIKLEKAHDVRELRGCMLCGRIGDRRYMPKIGRSADRGYAHGACALAYFGLNQLFQLPHQELGKISLGEVGPQNMRAICDHLERAP